MGTSWQMCNMAVWPSSVPASMPSGWVLRLKKRRNPPELSGGSLFSTVCSSSTAVVWASASALEKGTGAISRLVSAVVDC